MPAPFWRSGWDSNPRAIARKLISSQPRYDHFDTAAFRRFPGIPAIQPVTGTALIRIPYFCALVNIAR